MTYEEFKAQLAWEPTLEGVQLAQPRRIVVGGMGGSALPAYAARFLEPRLPIIVHSDYDLPEDARADAQYLALSHSGNTIETLSFARAALERGFPLAAITSGGALAALARKARVPLIRVPGETQPRDALFYQLRALLAVIRRSEVFTRTLLDARAVEDEAAALAQTIGDTLPVFYASRKNKFLAHVAKIQCNETAKMPAYANAFPELNHNEMQSFDRTAPTDVAALARFVLLRDTDEDPRIARRMDVFTACMRERGRTVVEVAIAGESRSEKLVRTWFLIHRSALALARARGVDPSAIPLIEDFKKRL